MIPQFRPHILQYQVTIGEYEDEIGDYHPGDSHFEGVDSNRMVKPILLLSKMVKHTCISMWFI